MTSILTTPFDANITRLQVSEFLAALDKLASCDVYHQQVAYSNRQRKARDLGFVKKLDDSILDQNNTVTTKEDLLEEYKLLATVPTAVLKYKSSTGTLFFLWNNTNTIVEINRIRHSGEVHTWHAYVIYVQGGVVGIYDPSYVEDAGKTRLREMVGIPMALKMVEEMRKKRYTVKEVWIGGGGNMEDNCTEMSRQWMYEEIVEKGGVELGNWTERGWKQVSVL